MPFTTKAVALPVALAGGLMLSACGGGVEKDAMLESFAAECASSFASEGGPAELAGPFCDCSVAQIKEQDLGPMDLINQEKMTAIGESCMRDVMATMDGASEEAPATE